MGNMGLSMAGNLVKKGAVVKGFDLNAATLEKAKNMVSSSIQISSFELLIGNLPSEDN